MKTALRIISVICLLLSSFMLAMMLQNTDELSVSEYSFVSDKVSPSLDGFKIVQLSDLHNHPDKYKNTTLTEAIDEQNPNIVVCTGDMVDSHTTESDYASIARLLSHLHERGYPVYYVSGNHEAYESEEATERFYGILSSAGVVNLEDKRISLAQGLTLSGIRDPAWVSTDFGFLIRNEGDVRAQLSGLDAGFDPDELNLLIAHRPELFDLYQAHGYDLSFAGHTHGNQIGLPWTPYAVNSFFPAYVAGCYARGSSKMIVSRGLGYSASLPWRYACNAEITSTVLRVA